LRSLIDDHQRWAPAIEKWLDDFAAEVLPSGVSLVDVVPKQRFATRPGGSTTSEYVQWRGPVVGRANFLLGLDDLYAMVEGLQARGELPGPQSPGTFDRLRISVKEGAVELFNGSPNAVDLSGWQLRPAGFTFPEGSV